MIIPFVGMIISKVFLYNQPSQAVLKGRGAITQEFGKVLFVIRPLLLKKSLT